MVAWHVPKYRLCRWRSCVWVLIAHGPTVQWHWHYLKLDSNPTIFFVFFFSFFPFGDRVSCSSGQPWTLDLPARVTGVHQVSVSIFSQYADHKALLTTDYPFIPEERKQWKTEKISSLKCWVSIDLQCWQGCGLCIFPAVNWKCSDLKLYSIPSFNPRMFLYS